MQSKEATAFTELAQMYGMDPAWLGETIMVTGRGECKIIGLMPRRKLSVLVENTAGQRYTVAPAGVARMMRAKVA